MATLKEKKAQAKEDLVLNTEELEQLENALNQEPPKPEGIPLTETELRLLTELKRKQEAVSREVSFLAQQQLTIDYRQEEAEKLYRDNIELEKQIGDTLTNKYGAGIIDIENGIFIPQ